MGRNVWEAFPEATATDLYPNYLQAMNTGEPCHFEIHYPALEEWFEINAYPSEDGLAVYFRPISQRKQIEQRLLESDERFRLVAQATVDTIWDWNLQTGEVWWNDGMAVMFGYNPEDLEPDGRSWTSRIHPDDHDATVAYINAIVKDRGCNRWEHEYRFRRKNGDYALVNDRGFVIRDHRGWGLRMVGGMSDITEHRRLEQRLQDAQRMEAIGQLTGGMAHDFNNLLTVILGNAELLADALDQQPDLRPLTELITSAASRGADLTQRLLAFARRQALTPTATDINERLPELQALLNSTLGDDIQLKVRPGPALWQALIDPTQLESALLNLCLNARDAMPGGGVLTIETGNVTADADLAQQVDGLTPGDYIRLSVSDTGSGIDPAIQQRVFEPFFSTKGPGRGTGLGLSMVYGFLKQSGGHVSLYSEPGTGTTVNLYLPRTESQSEPSQRASGKTPVTGGQELILLAEDDPMVRGYVLKQLQTAGYRVLEASSGPEALALLRQQPTVDLLFTDVMMPVGMTGPQLASAARQLFPGLPVLFTSGYTEDAMGENGQLPANLASHLTTNTTLSVNLSALSLGRSSLFDWIADRCLHYQIAPQRIIFEITESSAMRDPVRSLETLTRLRVQGFQLSIDDFGTGYSSMLQLVRLPFSEIKVDKTFVIQAANSAESRAVIRSVIDLGHSLGLSATAEGVEDEETLAYLRDCQCDQIQGFLMARPMAPEQVLPWLAQREQQREQQRVEALRQTGLLDTPPEARFDRITRLASRVFRVPVVLVVLIDDQRQFFKSATGVQVREVPRGQAFCDWTLAGDNLQVVPDTLQDPRFCELPSVRKGPRFRFYAGRPVCLANGQKAGTLCMMDQQVRDLTPEQQTLFHQLADMVEQELRLPSDQVTDSLTGLPDRLAFRHQMELARDISHRLACRSALIIVTLNNLGETNRRLGREAGNRMIRQLSQILQQLEARADLTGRYRGNEFGIVLIDTDAHKAEAFCQELTRAITDWNQQFGGGDPIIWCHIGLAWLDPASTASRERDIEIAIEQARQRIVSVTDNGDVSPLAPH